MKTQNFLPAILIVVTMLTSSCNYYMVSSVRHPEKKIEQELKNTLQDTSRYFIFHVASNTYAMNQIQFDSAKGIISFTPDTVASSHMLYIQRHGRDSSRMRFAKLKGEMPVLNEVHVYSQSYSVLKMNSVMTIPLGQIARIDVLSKNKLRSTLSGVFGFGLPAIAAVAAILGSFGLFTFHYKS